MLCTKLAFPHCHHALLRTRPRPILYPQCQRVDMAIPISCATRNTRQLRPPTALTNTRERHSSFVEGRYAKGRYVNAFESAVESQRACGRLHGHRGRTRRHTASVAQAAPPPLADVFHALLSRVPRIALARRLPTRSSAWQPWREIGCAPACTLARASAVTSAARSSARSSAALNLPMSPSMGCAPSHR